MRNFVRLGCWMEARAVHAHGHNVHRHLNSGGHESAPVEFARHPDFIHLVAARHPIGGQALSLKHRAADIESGLRVTHKRVRRHMHHAAKCGGQVRCGECGERCLRVRAQLRHKGRHRIAHRFKQHAMALGSQLGGERAGIIGVAAGFKDGRMPAHGRQWCGSECNFIG